MCVDDTYIPLVSPRPTHAGLDPVASEAFVALLRVAGRLLHELNAACAGHDITHDQYNVLRILRGVHPLGHPRYEIAARLVSRAPDVTRLLDRLEARGLVARGPHPENRRLSIATLTPAGLELLARVDPDIDAVARRYMAALGEHERRQLLRACERMLAP
jgi:DNA-binding MarR family transcriptional regulator